MRSTGPSQEEAVERIADHLSYLPRAYQDALKRLLFDTTPRSRNRLSERGQFFAKNAMYLSWFDTVASLLMIRAQSGKTVRPSRFQGLRHLIDPVAPFSLTRTSSNFMQRLPGPSMHPGLTASVPSQQARLSSTNTLTRACWQVASPSPSSDYASPCARQAFQHETSSRLRLSSTVWTSCTRPCGGPGMRPSLHRGSSLARRSRASRTVSPPIHSTPPRTATG